jgi:hypothetical protein
MTLNQRLARAMACLSFEMHFFTLTADRQRVLLFLESRDGGAVVEGMTMADCIAALEREVEQNAGPTPPRGPRRGPATRRAAQRGLSVIDGGR